MFIQLLNQQMQQFMSSNANEFHCAFLGGHTPSPHLPGHWWNTQKMHLTCEQSNMVTQTRCRMGWSTPNKNILWKSAEYTGVTENTICEPNFKWPEVVLKSMEHHGTSIVFAAHSVITIGGNYIILIVPSHYVIGACFYILIYLFIYSCLCQRRDNRASVFEMFF